MKGLTNFAYSDEYTKIKNKIVYSNGSEYIFYKMALYGYSTFEIKTKKTFEYLPKCSYIEKRF